MTTQTQCELISANEPQFALTATPVPDEQRLDFWPQHFGFVPQWITLEPRIFAWMDRFCDEYSGGIVHPLTVEHIRRVNLLNILLIDLLCLLSDYSPTRPVLLIVVVDERHQLKLTNAID